MDPISTFGSDTDHARLHHSPRWQETAVSREWPFEQTAMTVGAVAVSAAQGDLPADLAFLPDGERAKLALSRLCTFATSLLSGKEGAFRRWGGHRWNRRAKIPDEGSFSWPGQRGEAGTRRGRQ